MILTPVIDSAEIHGTIETITTVGITGWAVRPGGTDSFHLTPKIDGIYFPPVLCEPETVESLRSDAETDRTNLKVPRFKFAVYFGEQFQDNQPHTLGNLCVA
jgi:hypothetical protein